MMEAKRQRMEEVLRKARAMFIQDAAQRMESARANIYRYESQDKDMSMQQLGKELYGLAHTLRGMALTVGCTDVDIISSSALSHIIQHESSWTIESMNQLVLIIGKLDVEIRRLAGQ